MKIGIIGGSGLEKSEFFTVIKEKKINTPFGMPSSNLIIGKIQDIDTVLIRRHGNKHEINPTNVNYQANVQALKQENCTHIIGVGACGSLQEKIKPGDFVILDQFIDRTTKRKQTFYENDKVAHISMAEPFCPKIRNLLIQTCKELKYRFWEKGTIVVIEGPRFSTRAESNLFRMWKADVLGMTTVPEVVLAREAGICYSNIAMVTDYDCFMEDRKEVTLEEVLAVMKENSEKVLKLIANIATKLQDWECKCQEDIKTAVIDIK